jgi:hypothetical protein
MEKTLTDTNVRQICGKGARHAAHMNEIEAWRTRTLPWTMGDEEWHKRRRMAYRSWRGAGDTQRRLTRCWLWLLLPLPLLYYSCLCGIRIA